MHQRERQAKKVNTTLSQSSCLHASWRPPAPCSVLGETARFVARHEEINNTQMMLVQTDGLFETRKSPTENHSSFLILYPPRPFSLHNSCHCQNEAASSCRRWESAEHGNSLEPGDVREGALPNPSPAIDFLCTTKNTTLYNSSISSIVGSCSWQFSNSDCRVAHVPFS